MTIPNVKDALNAFDATNCMVAGLEIPASLQASPRARLPPTSRRQADAVRSNSRIQMYRISMLALHPAAQP